MNTENKLVEAFLTEEPEQPLDKCDNERQQLACMIASGKSEEFLGKKYALKDLEAWNDKKVFRYHEIYRSALAAKTSQSIRDAIIHGYTSLVSRFAAVDTSSLKLELQNDYIINRELDRISGVINYMVGGTPLAVINTCIMTKQFVCLPLEVTTCDTSCDKNELDDL